MFLVAGRRKKFGLVENAQEFRNMRDEIEERAEPLNLLPRRMRGAGALGNESHHVDADFRQQLIKQLLAIFEMIIERALRHAGLFGDPGDGGLGIAVFADDPGGGVEYLALGPGVALDPFELCHFGGRGPGRVRHALASSSARSTRLSTLPDGLRGSWSRLTSCFGTLTSPSRFLHSPFPSRLSTTSPQS